jgi:hypothetical protein
MRIRQRVILAFMPKRLSKQRDYHEFARDVLDVVASDAKPSGDQQEIKPAEPEQAQRALHSVVCGL